METRTKILILVLVLVSGVAIGRYSVPVNVTEQHSTNETKDKTSNTEKDKTVTTKKSETKLPDGTVKTETEIVETTQTRKNTEVTSTKQTTDSVEKVRANESLTISAMVGADPFNLTNGYSLGVGIQKPVPILGIPLVFGAWGLPSNKLYGLSAGLRF